MTPSETSYRNLLRATRECGIGKPKTFLSAVSMGSIEGREVSKLDTKINVLNEDLNHIVGNEVSKLDTKIDVLNEDLNQDYGYGTLVDIKTKRAEKMFRDIDRTMEKYYKADGEIAVATDTSTEERFYLSDYHTLNSTEPTEETFEISEELETECKDVTAIAETEAEDWWKMDVFKDCDSQSTALEESQHEFPPLPNILDPSDRRPMPQLNYSQVTGPVERFALLGGLQSFLDIVEKYKYIPDVRMFSLLAAVTPLDGDKGKQLIGIAKHYDVEVDRDFYNQLLDYIFKQFFDDRKFARDKMQVCNFSLSIILFL